MTNRHHRRGGRTTPKGSRPASASAGSGPGAGSGRVAGRSHRGRPAGPPFLADAREALAGHSPLGLMTLASILVQATTPQASDRFAGSAVDRPDPTAVFLSFTDPDWPPLNALALAASLLTPDDELSRRLRLLVDPAEVEGAPPWLAEIDRIEVTGVWRQSHVLGDGDNIVLGWSWPGGQAASAVIYIDHNVGSLVKDAFVVDEPLEDLLGTYRGLADPDMRLDPLDPAEAGARIAEAIARADITIPPFESDTWPLCRPLVQWVAAHLPAGGALPEADEWSEEARADLVDQFLQSGHSAVDDLAPDQVRELVDNLVWFACDYGPGDPLRWSPVSVEIVLADWYPRKVFAPTDDVLGCLPDVLAGFVSFCHGRTGIRAELTEEALAAVEEWRAEYLAAIAEPDRSPQSNAARLARLAAGLDPDALEAFAALDDEQALNDDLDDYYRERGDEPHGGA
ncbi:MAG: hypothetical protein R2761_26425 [Acidimicrobiales bacterium]